MHRQSQKGMIHSACPVKTESTEAKFISVSKNLRVWGSRKSSVMERDALRLTVQ